MNDRLYYYDSYLREFTAQVLETASGGTTAYLDRTAFYPTSGGQPFDMGSIAGVPVVEVIEEDERIAHRTASELPLGVVSCEVDWPRRFDHMQQHSGQHLLSAVLAEHFGLHTVSFHLGQESSTIDLEGGMPAVNRVREIEKLANEIVHENRPVTVEFEEAGKARGLRKPSDREGLQRIICIQDLDRSACGGTHVRATGEIGPILIRKLDRVRETVRMEFLCGGRAVRRARADYDALDQVARLFSAPLDEMPALVAAQLNAARAGDKARRKLEIEMASYQGRELYQATAPGPDGVRRHKRRLAGGSVEGLRSVAQSFTEQPRAVFAAALEDPPSVLFAVSADLGIDAGNALRAVLAAAGGRGGGTARLAQGSVHDPASLDALLEKVIGAAG